MNAGRDYTKAKAHAQANANLDGMPRWLHGYGGTWWISKTPVKDGEKIERQPQQCPRHSDAVMKKLKKPPATANRDLIDGTEQVCDRFDYWECPICKTHTASPKRDL